MTVAVQSGGKRRKLLYSHRVVPLRPFRIQRLSANVSSGRTISKAGKDETWFWRSRSETGAGLALVTFSAEPRGRAVLTNHLQTESPAVCLGWSCQQADYQHRRRSEEPLLNIHAGVMNILAAAAEMRLISSRGSSGVADEGGTEGTRRGRANTQQQRRGGGRLLSAAKYVFLPSTGRINAANLSAQR